MKIQLTILSLILISVSLSAQEKEQNVETPVKTKLYYNIGLMPGHPNDYYPAPFTSNISLTLDIGKRLEAGIGSGAEIIGKTFIPVFAKIKYEPFGKPIFFYEKIGYTFCVTQSSDENNNYYYSQEPHPNISSVTTKGGIMNEAGIGILFDKEQWDTTISIGYRYMETTDEHKAPDERLYENYFNRLVIRLGFVF